MWFKLDVNLAHDSIVTASVYENDSLARIDARTLFYKPLSQRVTLKACIREVLGSNLY
jgi:hypothetical protein